MTGSDSGVYPPASTLLDSLGISYFPSFSSGPTFTCAGSGDSWKHHRSGNPELKKRSKVKSHIAPCRKYLKRYFFPANTRSLSAARTAKPPPRQCWRGFSTPPENSVFLVGGVAENFGKSYGLGQGTEMILEGDEYETAFWDRGPKFFHYHPDYCIITALEYDHADIYPDFDTYKLAFRRLVNLVPRNGRVMIWGDTDKSGPALREIRWQSILPGDQLRIFF